MIAEAAVLRKVLTETLKRGFLIIIYFLFAYNPLLNGLFAWFLDSYPHRDSAPMAGWAQFPWT